MLIQLLSFSYGQFLIDFKLLSGVLLHFISIFATCAKLYHTSQHEGIILYRPIIIIADNKISAIYSAQRCPLLMIMGRYPCLALAESYGAEMMPCSDGFDAAGPSETLTERSDYIGCTQRQNVGLNRENSYTVDFNIFLLISRLFMALHHTSKIHSYFMTPVAACAPHATPH